MALLKLAIVSTLVMMTLGPRQATSQHYCWPCALEHPVVGKDTHAASAPDTCYAFYFTYLNNINTAAGSPGNTGQGYHTAVAPGLGNMSVVESDDRAPNIMALESNECGSTVGNFLQNITSPLSPAAQALIKDKLRLTTGAMHQCKCAVQGRAHIINGTPDTGGALHDFAPMEAAWGANYTARAQAAYTKQVCDCSKPRRWRRRSARV